MGTHSCIAIPQGDGWKGRYCHWDGYPTWNGLVLAQIVRRDGAELAVKALTEDHFEWSSLRPTKAEGLSHSGTYIEGYGYTDEDSAEAGWITHDEDGWGTEWCYVILPSGDITVLRDAGYTDSIKYNWVICGTIPRDVDLEDLQVFQDLECGKRLEYCSHVENYHKTA